MDENPGADNVGSKPMPLNVDNAPHSLAEDRAWSALSTLAFARDWGSEEDQAYDAMRRTDV